MEETFDIGGRVLVLFDGHCGLCNGAVRWLLKRDREDRLRFLALESERAAGVLERHGMSGADLETMVVVRDAGSEAESVLGRSDAAVALLQELPRPWPWFGAVLGWVPRVMRDFGYRVVARWRYRIWGRLEICPVPAAEERERFL